MPGLSSVKYIKKRDGNITTFHSDKISSAVSKAVNTLKMDNSEKVIEVISKESLEIINQKFSKSIPTIEDVGEIIINSAKSTGFISVARAYQDYRDLRKEARKVLAVMTRKDEKNTTDSALLIESSSTETQDFWDRKRVVQQLEKEAGLSYDLAKDISKRVENVIIQMYNAGIRKLTTTDVRALTDLILSQEGLQSQKKRQELFGLPAADVHSIIFSRSNENSNIASNNPEAFNLEIAERVQKQYALENVFSDEVASAHLNGAIHLHDLGYITRVYCSSHSLEYIKKYGLNLVLANLEAKSKQPNSAVVLNQHVQTFLASLQAHYAGALGFGFLNIFYSPLINRPVEVIKVRIKGVEMEIEKRDLIKLLEQGGASMNDISIISQKNKLKELSYSEIKQIAQNLIFAASQNAFSRGGQTLFIDFNVHTGIPHYLREVPAVGPSGKYMIMHQDESVEYISDAPRFMNPKDKNDPRNGDADSSQIKEGKIITYGDMEKTSQKFARALLEVWKEGDMHGRPFHFPKCDLHIDENTLKDEEQMKLFDFACEITAENGSVYFMFDRGNGAVLAQCCRLKEKIEDPAMLKYPEKLRFCGFQNVTMNLAQAAYKGKDLKGTLKELDNVLSLVFKAHKQKADFLQKLLDTDGTPMRNLGRNSDDGTPYLDLKKATYIIGVIGLNEAVQFLTGKQLHEEEDSYVTGLKIIAHLNKKIKKLKEATGLKFTIEETPGESTTRRFAKVDLQKFPEAKEIVKGTTDNPYYTNSIHFAPDAPINLVDRIIGQSKFHEMIESGAIVHAYIGEKRPDKEVIKHIVKKTLQDTRCAQLVFSPTYTECDECGNVMPGEKALCNTNLCKNNNEKTLDPMKLFIVTRIVGYYSRLVHWNSSQRQIYQDRKKAEEFYAGTKGESLSWLNNPTTREKLTIIEFGKKNCPYCKMLNEQISQKIKDLKLEDDVEFKVNNLDEDDILPLVEAAMYGIPLDTFPSIVIAGKSGYWKKTNTYSSNCQEGVCNSRVEEKEDIIMPKEIEEEIKKRLASFCLR